MEYLKHLANENNKEIDKFMKDLSRGTAADHGEYKYACGIVRGLELANSKIVELKERLEKDDYE
jgi:hypothetical protein